MKIPVSAVLGFVNYYGGRRLPEKVDWLARLRMVDTISRDERYLFDLILKARRKAIALYLRFRKGQSVRDIWGSSAFPIVLSPHSAVQRLQCWKIGRASCRERVCQYV